MSPDYVWTAVGWVLTSVAFLGSGAFIVWGAFDSLVEDEEAGR